MIAALSPSAGILLRYANRHGLISGQTGTGKSVSVMRLAESLSAQGVPVFVADVKGDVSALARSCPAALLDCFGEEGQPVTVPFAAFGPELAARALDLSDAQAGVLDVAFHVAARLKVSINTISDMRKMIALVASNPEFQEFGNVSRASVAVIQRQLLRLEREGGDAFFRAPCFDVARLLETAGEFGEAGERMGEMEGHGLVSILQAQRLINSPRIYGAFLLWLLSDLWERLPEVGDLARPRLVLIFDESHLIFQGIAPALMQRIERTVRLIRSKGVGVYFASQAADDVPEAVRAQLAHVINHDRRLGVGKAMFTTIAPAGHETAPTRIQVAMPKARLGALAPDEKPATPSRAVSGERKAGGGTVAAGLALCALAAGMAGGAWWLWATDRWPWLLLPLLVLYFFRK